MIFDPLVVHRTMMATPDRWPCYPLLPLIRHRENGGLDLGVLVHGVDPPGQATVFRACLFRFPMTIDDLLACPKEVFASLFEVVSAGWRVD